MNRDKENKKYVFFVSAIAAALKSLSPSGKRMRPMLAIFMQGLLYHLSVNLLGVGLASAALGQALIGIWCALQTFFFQYLFFGKDIVKSYETVLLWASKIFPAFTFSLSQALFSWIVFNGAIGLIVGAFGYYGFLRFSLQRKNLLTPSPHHPLTPSLLPSWKVSAIDSLKEMRRPYFLWPLLFVLAVGLLARQNLEGLAFACSRAALIAYLCTLAFKRMDFPALTLWLQNKGFEGPAQALNTAIEELNGRNA